MKTIRIFDEKNYDTSWQRTEREGLGFILIEDM